MLELSGKVAVVSGASTGIGAGIAVGLASAGAAVVVNYASNRDGAEAVADSIAAQGGEAIAVGADVTDAEQVQSLFGSTAAEFGHLDVLVNNAGVWPAADPPFERTTLEQFRWMFDTNVLGPFLLAQAALPHFGDRGGSIINVSSTVSVRPVPGSVVYGASKAALNGMSGGLARELGPRGIRVNCILPGVVDTAAVRSGNGLDREAIAAATPLGRVGLPSDIAPLAVFLASDASAWITGEMIAAAGGAA